MLLLTATAETQGLKPGDFCDAIEGELVVMFADCHVRAHQDDLLRCSEGCPPRFFGLNSHERTTTAMVRNVPVSREDYLLALSAYAEQRGSPAPQAMACVLGTQMVSAAVMHAPGTVVGFTAGRLADRAVPRRDWRNVAATASAMARSFAWRRHYDKVIQAADRARSEDR
jgi:hypothetical protein